MRVPAELADAQRAILPRDPVSDFSARYPQGATKEAMAAVRLAKGQAIKHAVPQDVLNALEDFAAAAGDDRVRAGRYDVVNWLRKYTRRVDYPKEARR